MKKFVLILVISLLLNTQEIYSKITAVFVDITALSSTDKMKASGYIGKLDSLKYIAVTGHKPDQKTLFSELKPMKAQSTQVTYNENLEMPLIFSDWLANIQPASTLKSSIEKYLFNKSIKEIEKKVLFAIICMMLTPQHLADTQTIHSKVHDLLKKIKDQDIKIFLVGNWTHIASLKALHPDLFSLFSGIFVSGDLQVLKPAAEFYTSVLEKTGIDKADALWIETESKFITAATSLGLKVAAFPSNNVLALITHLHQAGIKV